MKSATSTPMRGGVWRRTLPVGQIELLNARWHEPLGGPSRRCCPLCGADVSAGDHGVPHGSELDHADCARRRWRPA